MGADVDDRAHALLRQMAGPDASFHPQQLEAIRALVHDRQRVLLVQRTGYGKSAVYFIATRLLREAGSGPTLVISPLLALMRNQIDMAGRTGVMAASINSANTGEWDGVEAALEADSIDLLMVSPERLNNPLFRAQLQRLVAPRTGLLVIDEAHCISDWGHDFRPDYRRVARILDLLPGSVPVLCSTATANNRVVDDVSAQLGQDLLALRGTLERESLCLSTADMPSQAQRLAWLATHLPDLPGSGIVYCLTIRDTERVARWLRSRGIDAQAYSGASEPEERIELERRLLDNEVKALVSTSALGMGFDKPDLGFVVHYQTPGSPVAYYQQVGRAGRDGQSAHGIALGGSEDADIQDFFITSAFPRQAQAEAVVALLAEAAEPVSLNRIQAAVNLSKTRLESMLKILEVEGAVERVKGGWLRTLAAWTYDRERVDHVTRLRRDEQRAMREYLGTPGCLMEFLRAQLDDPGAAPCGRCANCTARQLPTTVDPALVAAARQHLRDQSEEIEPRRQWPPGLGDPRGRIPPGLQLQPGRALSAYGDGGWGDVVRDDKGIRERFSDELVSASTALIAEQWRPDPAPSWVTSVPSLRRPGLVADFAQRLAAALSLPYVDTVAKTRETAPPKDMQNSAQQVSNLHGAFAAAERVPSGPVLLVDDIVDSRWTITMVGILLRQAGSGPVLPFALASA